MTLDEMRKVDIRTVDPATLHDRRDVRIDSRQPREKRIASYLTLFLTQSITTIWKQRL